MIAVASLRQTLAMPSKGHRAFQPVYWADVLGRAMDLTPAEFGALMRIQGSYWQNGPPKDDEDRLARLTGMSLAEWRVIAPGIKPLFEIIEERWVHHGWDAELADAERRHKRKSEGARITNAKRSAKRDAMRAETEPESESDSSNEEMGVKAEKMAVYEQEFETFWGRSTQRRLRVRRRLQRS